ncbi:MAG: ABC transporter ATP-binding protein [Verrucomicrobia bacterium]|nr:ABC transporter ATP-binding protein [Verrucomicrobiota bacterium]
MATPIISVRNVSKRYYLGGALAHNTLRDHIRHSVDSLKQIVTGRKQASGKQRNGNSEDCLWALKDVSFDVFAGDVVGVVGRNGSGKSTLLKTLSQITEPTAGEIRVKGRIASLLEVGTGFHPELSGKENIFLNGAILGMSRSEIRAKFDEIVEFSEVQKFLDTPVKRYSSGMYVKLAFAVAAHLEPEILVVDEVLAVGDIQFQKKCLGKMADVSRSGRTILFVSHNLAAVQKLCTRAILLEQGNLTFDGSTSDCITKYLHGAKEEHGDFFGYNVSEEVLKQQKPEAPIRVAGIEMFDAEHRQLRHLNSNGGFTLRTHYECNGDFARGSVSFMISIKTHLGQEICRLSTMPISGYNIDELARVGHIDLTICSLPLVGGRYLVDVKIFRPAVETILLLTEVAAFDITPTDVYNSGIGMAQDRGLFVVQHRWNHHSTQPKLQLEPSQS